MKSTLNRDLGNTHAVPLTPEWGGRGMNAPLMRADPGNNGAKDACCHDNDAKTGSHHHLLR